MANSLQWNRQQRQSKQFIKSKLDYYNYLTNSKTAGNNIRSYTCCFLCAEQFAKITTPVIGTRSYDEALHRREV